MIRWLFRKLVPLRWRLLLLCHSPLACRLLGQKMHKPLRWRRNWERFFKIGSGQHVKLERVAKNSDRLLMSGRRGALR